MGGALNFLRLLATALSAAALAGGLGAYPLRRWGGADALAAMLVATGVVLLVVLGNGVLLQVVARRRGPLAAGRVFAAAAMPRIAVTALLALAAAWLRPLAPRVLLLWTAGLYFVMMMIECWWLCLGLRGATGRRTDM